jgi:hypothetical protein
MAGLHSASRVTKEVAPGRRRKKWWDTDYYSWSNRSTRLIGIIEAQ